MDQSIILTTKADILKGLTKRHTFQPEGYDFQLTIRPLRDSELEECEAVEASAIEFDFGDGGKQMQHMNPAKMGGVKIKEMDMDKIMKADKLSMRMKAAFGLSINEEWTVAEVKTLPAGVVEQLAKEVDRISGVKNKAGGDDLLEFFRQNASSGNDLSSGENGSSVGDDVKRLDAATKPVSDTDGKSRSGNAGKGNGRKAKGNGRKDESAKTESGESANE